jgi:signal peptidase I
LREIRALVPVAGDTWVKDIDVTIEPGRTNHQGQQLHLHDEWTAVFYVNPTSPIEVHEDGGYLVYPEPGDVVIMPPRIQHRATANKSDEYRLSFAMLVEDSRIPSKFSS